MNAIAVPNAQADPAFIMQQKIERLWHAALVQISRGNQEIAFPSEVRGFVGDGGITTMATRYSALTGDQVKIVEDKANNAIRILKPVSANVPLHPTLQSIENTSTFDLSTSPNAIVLTGSPGGRQRVNRSGRSKIPRPPNAFILYRRHHHPIVKAGNPNMCNNDISVVLGSQWRDEDPEVKAEFHALADIIKRKHLEAHPGYQYQPRRPSEKKRRMTRRKAAAALKNNGVSVAGGSTPVNDGTNSSLSQLPEALENQQFEGSDDWNFPATQQDFDAAFEKHLENLRDVPSLDQLIPEFNVNQSANLEINFPLNEEALNTFLLNWNAANASAPPPSPATAQIQNATPVALSSVFSDRCVEDEQMFTNTAGWEQIELEALRQAEELAKAFEFGMSDDGLYLDQSRADAELIRMQSLF